ncbi:MAG: Arc family DNA-binding protein [Fimbriimonadales bacterium]
MSEKKAFPLRISQDLWEELQRAAAEEFRSVNGQIEFLLRESLKKRGKSAARTSELSPEE